MKIAEPDQRDAARRALDEQIAAEPLKTPPNLPASAVPQPMEAHLGRLRRPLALAGVVENGLVRLLDPTAKLPEHARVIVVASEQF